jgi:hypothetical protein
VTAAPSAAMLRAEIDAVLADLAYHLDHLELADLFTGDALFITGALELRGRAEIKNRYMERTVVRPPGTLTATCGSPYRRFPGRDPGRRRRRWPAGPGARPVHLGAALSRFPVTRPVPRSVCDAELNLRLLPQLRLYRQLAAKSQLRFLSVVLR